MVSPIATVTSPKGARMTEPVPQLALEILAWARLLQPSGCELHRHLRDRGVAMPPVNAGAIIPH